MAAYFTVEGTVRLKDESCRDRLLESIHLLELEAIASPTGEEGAWYALCLHEAWDTTYAKLVESAHEFVHFECEVYSECSGEDCEYDLILEDGVLVEYE